ncbi:MAG: hypothetical protein Q8Q08_01995 [Candidatus Omnitrophota bacterium]|nr:hypothetical protein [Candidatus Omnitrophota bacterium]MDZ4241993.1 hypothetical protein [Candidatus Omnitrophota bacterium]
MNKRLSLYTAAVLTVLFFGAGLVLAKHRPVWNDEIYSSMRSHNISFLDILRGDRQQEGNNSPLFYVAQKTLMLIAQYTPPREWASGDNWSYRHPPSQIVLRFIPLACMALMMGILFYYFSRRFSAWAGGYALAVALSSFMVWAYWAEGRPYAQLMLLTTVQSLLLIDLAGKASSSSARRWLSVCHWLLALSSSLSMIQITAAAVVYHVSGKRAWKDHLGMTLAPLMICGFYYATSPKYPFWFADSPVQLISACVPKDRVLLLFLLGAFVALRFFRGQGKTEDVKVGMRYLFFLGMVFAGYVAVIVMLLLKEKEGTEGFQVSNRYFIALAPLGIVATTQLSALCVRLLRGRPLLQKGAILGLAVLLAFRSWKTFEHVQSLYRGIFSP